MRQHVRMPSYVAFLRAINLGAVRKFPKDAIRASAEAAGFTDVDTHINTGNVRLTTTMRSRPRIEAALEAAFLADRGFEVPTMVFSLAEVRAIADDAVELVGEHGEPAGHYITLFKDPPTAEAIAALEALSFEGEVAVVRGRAAHVLLREPGQLGSRVLNAKAFPALGLGTARNATVIRAIAEKWC